MKALECLPDKGKLLISLYYYEELTMKEIGEIMGYTESRISQMHTQAILHLCSKLSEYLQQFLKIFSTILKISCPLGAANPFRPFCSEAIVSLARNRLYKNDLILEISITFHDSYFYQLSLTSGKFPGKIKIHIGSALATALGLIFLRRHYILTHSIRYC